ncbi:hypothetical protein K438DRAFT_1798552, partial [Mycena galopus ATCC 62051]
MVTINLAGSSDNETPSKMVHNPVKPRARKSRAKIESTGPRLAVLSVKTTPRVKAEPGTAVKAESSGTFNFTPPSHADVNNLPVFMALTWASKFLQGAYLALSKAPKAMTFVTAANASVTVAALQEVLNKLYPGCGWKITWSDAICTKAVVRIGERCGAFGRSGIAAVDEEFKSIKYFGLLNGPEAGLRLLSKIQADAKYTLHFNGGKVDLTASVLPFGAFVMGAILIERGYKLHLTGDRLENTPPEFSATIYSTAATGYLKSICQMSANCWEIILTACGANSSSVAEAAAPELDTLDGARELMYCPSSP